MDQDATWYGGRPRFTRHCVRLGPSSPPLKGYSPPLSANVRCGQRAGWTKMPLGMEVGLGPGDYVQWGRSYPQKKMAHHPTQFLAHVYCGQTAGWIKMPLGTEVNLGLGDVVLDGVAAAPKRGTSPQFSVHVCCGETAGWMKTPLSAEVDLGPGHIVLDAIPALHERGTAAPYFRPMSIVARVAHLSYC